MQQQMDHVEAWKDFFKWIKKAPIWNDKDKMPRSVKQYINKANEHCAKGKLGRDRARGILEKYAPGRYKFLDIVELHGDPMP